MNKDELMEMYIELLKKTLTRTITKNCYSAFPNYMIPENQRAAFENLQKQNIFLTMKIPAKDRILGKDWPLDAETMAGRMRLDNIHYCILDVLSQGVPGDLIETGVWRGGTVIFMRALLKVYGIKDRNVWVADSFQGVPKPDEETYPHDAENPLWSDPELSVSMETVKENFASYGMLDEQVKFLPGWFRDTLPGAPVDKLAVLRLDGDLYESTIVALEALYHKVSPGGYLIVDDYVLPGCKLAVQEFRDKNNIKDEIILIDETSAYWKVESAL